MGGMGPERGQGQGMPKKAARPRPLRGTGRGKGPAAFFRPVRPVTNSMTNHTRWILKGLSLIRMPGEHSEESQKLYYLSVDWLNITMHGLNHLETRVYIHWETPRNQILKKESEIVLSTCMLHPTLISSKDHKTVRKRFLVK